MITYPTRATAWLAAVILGLTSSLPRVDAATIRGSVADASGKPMGGVMVSAFDKEQRKHVSVFSQPDGSFAIDGLRDVDHQMRARLMGLLDVEIEDIRPGTKDMSIQMTPATGMDLEEQRPANSALSMLKFDSMRDKLNFKMFCCYCHQVGTLAFRSPEQPIDWATMLTRMDGFGGLYPHTQGTIIHRLIETYVDDAVLKWPQFAPPPPPSGTAAKARITAWDMGRKFKNSYHDLELGPDGTVYVVDTSFQFVTSLDPKTGEQREYRMRRIRSNWGMMATCG